MRRCQQSLTSPLECGRETCRHRSPSTFFDAVIAATLSEAEHTGAGMRMQYNTKSPLVGSRGKCGWEVNVQDLEYADNMALVSDFISSLEEALMAHNCWFVGMGLTISTKQTKILAVCPATYSIHCPGRFTQEMSRSLWKFQRILSTWAAAFPRIVPCI